MAKSIVLLSGSVSSGKSTLAQSLSSHFGFTVVKTWELLRDHAPNTTLERAALQALGEKLDVDTGGAWVLDALTRRIDSLPDEARLVIDAVRMEGQIKAIRQGFGPRVAHVHLSADVGELEKRYKHRKRGDIKELASYSEVLKNKTESEVPGLAEIADVVISTDRCLVEDVLVRAASHLGLYGRGCERVVDVLIGGEFGSEGKGQISAYLSRGYDILLRVGGPNAGPFMSLRTQAKTISTSCSCVGRLSCWRMADTSALSHLWQFLAIRLRETFASG